MRGQSGRDKTGTATEQTWMHGIPCLAKHTRCSTRQPDLQVALESLAQRAGRGRQTYIRDLRRPSFDRCAIRLEKAREIIILVCGSGLHLYLPQTCNVPNKQARSLRATHTRVPHSWLSLAISLAKKSSPLPGVCSLRTVVCETRIKGYTQKNFFGYSIPFDPDDTAAVVLLRRNTPQQKKKGHQAPSKAGGQSSEAQHAERGNSHTLVNNFAKEAP